MEGTLPHDLMQQCCFCQHCAECSPITCSQHTSIVSHRCLLPGLLDTNVMHVQGDAAVVCVTRGLQQVIAAEEDHIQRLKHAAATFQPAVPQLS